MAKGNRPTGNAPKAEHAKPQEPDKKKFNERGIYYDGKQQSFKDKKSFLEHYKRYGLTEWTKHEAPRGHIYVEPDGALKRQDFLGALKEQGAKFNEIYGYRQTIHAAGGTYFTGPIDITLNPGKVKR